jgi:CBS-domain-containing membrane protein
MLYLKKFKGLSNKKPSRPALKQIAFVWLGGFIAISVVSFLALYTKQPLVMGSFGASCFSYCLIAPLLNLEMLLWDILFLH